MKIITSLVFISAISASQLVTQDLAHEDQQQHQQLKRIKEEKKHGYTMKNEDCCHKEQLILVPTEVASKPKPNGGGNDRPVLTKTNSKIDGINKEDRKKIAARLIKLQKEDDNQLFLSYDFFI